MFLFLPRNAGEWLWRIDCSECVSPPVEEGSVKPLWKDFIMEKIFMRSTRALLTGAAVFVTMTATTAHAVENLKDTYVDLGCGGYLAGPTDDNELTPKCLNLKERIERIDARLNGG